MSKSMLYRLSALAGILSGACIIIGKLLNRGTPDYIPFLLVGIVMWRWFDNSINQSCGAIEGSLHLISTLSFPKAILPTVSILIVLFKFLIVLLLLLIFLFFNGYSPTTALLVLPILLFVQFILTVSTFNVIIGKGQEVFVL